MKKTWKKALRRLYKAHTETCVQRWPEQYCRLRPAVLRELIAEAVEELDAAGGLGAVPRRLSAFRPAAGATYCHAMGLYIA